MAPPAPGSGFSERKNFNTGSLVQILGFGAMESPALARLFSRRQRLMNFEDFMKRRRWWY